MNEKEKAVNLYEKFWYNINIDDDGDRHDTAVVCALICVDQILKAVFEHQNAYDYWREVEHELKQLQ